MDTVEAIEEKVRLCVKLIASLREQNAKINKSNRELTEERELLLQENQQVRKILAELDKLKSERKIVQQKLEKLSVQFHKLKMSS